MSGLESPGDASALEIYYHSTKFDVCNYTYSRFMEGGLKFNVWSLDPDHALLGGYFVMLEMVLANVYIIVRNLTFL